MVPMARIRVVATDSALTPKDNGSYSSRVSFMVGNAALRAARGDEAAAGRRRGQEARGARPTTSTGRASRCGVAGTDRSLDFAQVVAGGADDTRHADREGRVVDAAGNAGRQVPRRGRGLDCRLLVRGAGGRSQRRRGHRRGRRRAASGSRTTAASRSTRWRWKARCRAPCGWAWARRCQRGDPVPRGPAPARQLLDYRVPTIAESPPIEVTLIESIDPLGPFGAKEASEGALHGFARRTHRRRLRRHWHPGARAADYARPRVRRDPCAPA